jgi:hypothetical protein
VKLALDDQGNGHLIATENFMIGDQVRIDYGALFAKGGQLQTQDVPNAGGPCKDKQLVPFQCNCGGVAEAEAESQGVVEVVAEIPYNAKMEVDEDGNAH